jgi:hypothetical protein
MRSSIRLARLVALLPICLGIAAMLAPGAAGAQRGGTAASSSGTLGDAVTRALNDTTATVIVGDHVLPAGETRRGTLVVLDGDLTLGGAVEGDVVVANGELRFEPGARVTGQVVVMGGSVANSAAARIGGEVRSHTGEYAYERVDGRYRQIGGSVPRAAPSREGADFLITTGKSYNRVEGLPIAFGPRLETPGSNPLRLQALAIYRTESGLTLDTDRMGYHLQADQFLGGRREYRIGGTAHSVVDPIEEWHLSDLETGLATFLFHRDYRDHFERTGWSVFGVAEPEAWPFLVRVEARWDRHRVLDAGSPWSLFRNAEPWRPQPVVAEGRLGSIVLSAEYDSRSEEWNPASGLHLRGRVEQVIDTDLRYPAVVATIPGDQASPLGPEYGRFTSAFADLRSYNRLDPDSRINVRVIAGGSLTGVPLPPQRQHAFGGEGSLPGYPLFSADCGARRSPVRLVSAGNEPTSPAFYPHYGCDAFGVIQAEYRGKLAFRFGWDGGPWREGRRGRDREERSELGWDVSPDWTLFVDAGRGWSFHDDRSGEDTIVDVGAGMLIDRIGIFLAVPVVGGSGVNLFVRLGPRF